MKYPLRALWTWPQGSGGEEEHKDEEEIGRYTEDASEVDTVLLCVNHFEY